MNKILLPLVILISFSVNAQINPEDKILSCEWKVDQIETFIIVLKRKAFSRELSNFSEDRMIGPRGRYIESYNSKPSFELNPAGCVLRVTNSQFSIPSHRLTYQLKVEQNELRITELSGFGPNMEDQNFVCEISNNQIMVRLKDQCAQHSSFDGFVPMDSEFRLDSSSITNLTIQKEVLVGPTSSSINSKVTPQ